MVEAFIEKGMKEGASLTLDGRGIKVPGYEAGYFLAQRPSWKGSIPPWRSPGRENRSALFVIS